MFSQIAGRRYAVVTLLVLSTFCAGLGIEEPASSQFPRLREQIVNQPRSFENEIYFAWDGKEIIRSDRFTGQSDLFGDFDGDGDVDKFDYNAMQICVSFSGPGIPTPPACYVFDADADGDIDLYDAAEFWRVLTGPLGGVVAEAGNLVPIVWSAGNYYSGEPGTWGNNALNGVAAQAGYGHDNLWYEWSLTFAPDGTGRLIISNPSRPATAYTILSPVMLGSHVYELVVTNLITLERASDTAVLAVVECLEDADCADRDACTTDTCNDYALCEYADVDCDDGDACTANACDSRTGCLYPNIECIDGNVCTDDSCDPTLGCVYENDAKPCDDGLFCNGADTCAGGSCSVHAGDPCTPVPCDEGNDDCIGCPSGPVIFVDPLTGTIDARQPYPPNNAAQRQGIRSFRVQGPSGIDDTNCWALCETRVDGTPNLITSIVDNGDGTFNVHLARTISIGAVTTLTYIDADGARYHGLFTSHPANVNADNVSSLLDQEAINHIINGLMLPPWGIHSCDVDHTGVCGQGDAWRVTDLLNGADQFDPWLGVQLPQCGACCL